MQVRLTPSIFAIAALGLNAVSPVAAQTRPAPGPGASTLPSTPGASTLPAPAPQPTTMPLPRPPVITKPMPPVVTRPVPPRPGVRPPATTLPSYPNYPNNSRGYAGTIRCESRNNDLNRCRVRTENRVDLLRRHNGDCQRNRGWGYTSNAIWVSRNCRATFGYGYGNNGWNDNNWQDDRDGPSTAAVIGGVLVAGGLIAVLANSGKKSPDSTTTTEAPTSQPKTYPPGPPAAISADLSAQDPAVRPSLQVCLFEAARQIGATGGTAMRLGPVSKIEPGNGGYRFTTELTATYPDREQKLPMYCRATSSKVVQLDFTTG